MDQEKPPLEGGQLHIRLASLARSGKVAVSRRNGGIGAWKPQTFVLGRSVSLRPGGMRACPAGLPVKAHAPVEGQVSNIRLRPSPRVDIGATNGPKRKPRAISFSHYARFFARYGILDSDAAGFRAVKPFERSGDGGASGTSSSRVGEDPFRSIYEREAPGLIRFFRRRTGSRDEAEDLAQETLTRFLRASQRVDVETPQAFLRTIATNLLRDRAIHSSKRWDAISTTLDHGESQPADDDQHRDLVSRQELEHFEGILKRLKPRTLEIFLLSRVEGYTYQEIANKLGMTLFGVKFHMLKAIEHVDKNRRSR